MKEVQAAPVYVIKIGGSVIAHSNKLIDFDYLREFRDLLQEQIVLGKRFVIIIGGGQLCRDYLNHARENGKITNHDNLHWIGTATTVVNAEMVKAFLPEDLTEQLCWKYSDIDRIAELDFQKPIAVVGGYAAGISTDMVALKVATALNLKQVFDLKAVAGVFNKDPNIFPNAKLHNKLTWKKYLGLIADPKSHSPGASYPVDVVAARAAKDAKIVYHILGARDFHNLEGALSGLEYHGTTIS